MIARRRDLVGEYGGTSEACSQDLLGAGRYYLCSGGAMHGGHAGGHTSDIPTGVFIPLVPMTAIQFASLWHDGRTGCCRAVFTMIKA